MKWVSSASIALSAFPPDPRPFSVLLPGECTVQLKRKGEGLALWYETVDHEKLTFSAEKFYFLLPNGDMSDKQLTCDTLHLGEVSQKGHVVQKILSRKPKLELLPSMPQPVGNANSILKNMVILIQWNDHNVSDVPQSSYDTLFNLGIGEKDADHAPTGSVKDFFHNQSYGQMTIESVVSPWIESSYTEAEAAGSQDKCNALCEDPNFTLQRAIMEAIEKFEIIIGSDEFLTFDSNNDGYVDMITVVHSGRGAELSNPTYTTNYIWSHKFFLLTSFTDSSQMGYTAPLSGLQFWPYNINAGRCKYALISNRIVG